MGKNVTGKVVVLLALLLAFPAVGRGQMAVGKWRDCPDLSFLLGVEVADGKVYAAGRAAVLCYDTEDHTISILGKSTGLNDAGIATIAYDGQTATLAVAYTNSNMDLLQGGRVYNLSDIRRSSLAGDKSVHSVRFHGGAAYLATAFGIVVVDLERHEIKETYYIGDGGGRVAVYDIAFTPDSIYAATAEGLKRLALSERHPGISDRWQADSRISGMTIARLASQGGTLVAAAYSYDPGNLSLLRLTDGGCDTLLTGDIRNLHSGGGLLAVSTSRGIWRYDDTLGLVDSLTLLDGWADLSVRDAVADGKGNLWVAHGWLGLVKMGAEGNAVLRPEGPASGDNVYRLVPAEGRMLLCPGGHTTTHANSYIAPQLPSTDGRTWRRLDLSGGLLDGTSDLVDACVNPRDTAEVFAALWGYGVASVRNGKVQALYGETNTGGVLSPYVEGAYRTLRTGALAADRSGNLWVLNSLSPSALAVRRPDGSWQAFSTSALSSRLEVDKLLWDSITGYLWFAGRDNALYVHDGTSRLARVNPNNGSKLQTQAINALVQDRNGNLWIGTDQGIKVVYNGASAFANGGNGETSPVACSNITITNGDFYEYLMAYENVTAIAVDGANRKWVGTASGGLYLLSADGLEQLLHFTAADSPLYSDKVTAIGIEPRSGEVYVGTDRGLQVYRSTATYATAAPREEVYAFPNPVRPGYDGPVAIKGFTRDALVHITDAAGHTVFTTQALGGQAIWNGRAASGERVGAGVYYVFAADAEGGNRSVTKILVVR